MHLKSSANIGSRVWTRLVSRKHDVTANLCSSRLDTWCIAVEPAETRVVRRRAKVELGWPLQRKSPKAVVRPPGLINLLLKATPKLRGHACAVTILVAYGLAESSRGENKTRSAKSRRVVLLMDANTSMGRRGGEMCSEHFRVLGAYSRNTRYINLCSHR